MAISTYSDLQTALASWMAREGDTGLTGQSANFISLFEARINRVLRVRQMEATATVGLVSGVGTLPTDFLEARRVTWQGSPKRELEYVVPSLMQAAYPDEAESVPYVYTIEGSSLKVKPASSVDVQLLYWQKIPSLSDASPSNWLLTAYPDLYLFGSLVEANAFTKEPDAASMWGQREAGIVAEIKALDVATRGSSAIRPSSATP